MMADRSGIHETIPLRQQSVVVSQSSDIIPTGRPDAAVPIRLTDTPFVRKWKEAEQPGGSVGRYI
jgi:hypothetical protein